MKKYKKPAKIFLRAQTSAFVGGLVDYLVMIVATEFLLIHYTISIAIGGFVGAIVNFSINRHWTYNEHKSSTTVQFFKFLFVVAGSILLKSLGTYLITTGLNIDYKISRIMVDLIVSLGFNFVLQKYWVFKKV